jgi:hypothetical protein
MDKSEWWNPKDHALIKQTWLRDTNELNLF